MSREQSERQGADLGGKEINVQELDANMARPDAEAPDRMQWLSPLAAPFQIAGFAWIGEEQRYRRLPVAPAFSIPPAVDALANCTAGGQIRFRTNTSRLAIRVKLGGPGSMYHMPATGQCGFDCYVGDPADCGEPGNASRPGKLHYLSTTWFDHTKTEYEADLYQWDEKREYVVTLNFPLYQAVEEVWIGLDADAELQAPPAYASERPVVIYGTSITQGGCASRPGMAYPNLLSRRINLPFLNLGFSGNGRGEPELAEILATISQPAMFILDYEANTSAELMAVSLPAFIQILRRTHPDVKIVVLSCIRYARYSFDAGITKWHDDCALLQQAVVRERQQAGDRHIHFIDGSELLGEDEEECTVDGVHPTDLGFLRMARALEPQLAELLAPVLGE